MAERSGLQALSLFSLLLLGLVAVSQSQEDNLRQIVRTNKGQVRGTRTFITNEQIPVDRFLGIPYAKPPVGERRYRPPVEAEPWATVKDATEYASACYHDFTNTGFRGADMWNPTVPVDEDCLYLNIWAPRNIRRPMTKLTTMVWIYGGAFVSGSSDLPVYDGSFLAATHNVIVVSMNYRLGPFGFLNLGVAEAAGNAGLMDQSLALKWTYQNIEAFGGDRGKIAIFGESAGAASVSHHLLAQPSWDYFSAAIMQSGSALNGFAFIMPRKSIEFSTKYASEVGCSSDDPRQIAQCLRRKTPRELSNFKLNALNFRPTVDGTFITKSPEDLLANKDFKRCNILLGFNTDEETYFMSYFYPQKFGHTIRQPYVSLQEIRNTVNKVTISTSPIFPNSTLAFDSLLQVYFYGSPKQQRGTNVKVIDDIVGDNDFKCPVIEFARAYASENLGVYLYHFHHRSPTNPWPEWMGVMHGYEIEFVFGMPYNSSAGYSTEDKRVSDVLMSYWVTFSSTGNPNSQDFGERVWPNFTTADERYKVLKSDLLETKQYPRYAQCSFWRNFLPVLENYTESTAEAMTRCAGCRDLAVVLSVVVSAVFAVLIASTNG